jgi:aryl-alcohol dehydrogenase-like predicted oxidoreductase
MEYVSLGRSGLKVSRIALGAFSFGDAAWQTWVLNTEQSGPIIRRAIELGINFLDTADMYSNGVSEEIIGRWWPDFARREELVLSTKASGATGPSINERGLSRKHLFDAIDLSLKRLRTDYVDIYQLHRADHTTPIEETLEAMHDIVKAGKARYVGVSNMLAWQLMRTLAICDKRGWVRPISIQNHYNLAYREEEREMLPLCQLENIGMTPWSPLARGFLAGNTPRDGAALSSRGMADPYIRSYFSEDHDYAVLDEVKACAARHNASMPQVALAWLLSKPTLSAPIIGATKISHVESAAAALELKLTPEDITALERPYRPHKVLLHL